MARAWWKQGVTLRRSLARRLGHARQRLRYPLEEPPAQLDKGMGSLTADLEPAWACSTTRWSSGWASSAGPLGSTRTAVATTGRGRWSVVMGGGGLKGGQAIGATDKDGVDITDQPVGVMDLIATMTKTMGIPLDKDYTTPRGRPIKVVDGGKPVTEITG